MTHTLKFAIWFACYLVHRSTGCGADLADRNADQDYQNASRAFYDFKNEDNDDYDDET